MLTLLKDTGGFIGESGDRQDYVLQKVHQWSDLIGALASITTMQLLLNHYNLNFYVSFSSPWATVC